MEKVSETMYEAPRMETIELEVENSILDSGAASQSIPDFVPNQWNE
jgi:hypothetical protein